jgi:hypothetical protein
MYSVLYQTYPSCAPELLRAPEKVSEEGWLQGRDGPNSPLRLSPSHDDHATVSGSDGHAVVFSAFPAPGVCTVDARVRHDVPAQPVSPCHLEVPPPLPVPPLTLPRALQDQESALDEGDRCHLAISFGHRAGEHPKVTATSSAAPLHDGAVLHDARRPMRKSQLDPCSHHALTPGDA